MTVAVSEGWRMRGAHAGSVTAPPRGWASHITSWMGMGEVEGGVLGEWGMGNGLRVWERLPDRTDRNFPHPRARRFRLTALPRQASRFGRGLHGKPMNPMDSGRPASPRICVPLRPLRIHPFIRKGRRWTPMSPWRWAALRESPTPRR